MELGVSHVQNPSSLTPIVDNIFDKYNKNLVPIRSLSDHDSIFKKTPKAYMDDPINWDGEMENVSNISHEEVIYEFDHQNGENVDLPMLGAQTKVNDLKPVKAILERTPNFPRSLEGSQPLKLRVVFKRNQPFENQVITHVATREAREEVYRQVGIETSRQSDMVEAMEQSTETPLSIDAATGEVLNREQMELGSPITKVRKVIVQGPSARI